MDYQQLQHLISSPQQHLISSFLPLKNEECWWGSRDPKTVYVWDSMDDQDKQKVVTVLQEAECHHECALSSPTDALR